MPEYSLLTAVAMIGVVLVELLWLKTGIFHTAQYWCAIAIVVAFQIPVDGYLTKLSDPIVVYNEQQILGLRFPWDIPVEDFGFGFAMVTLVILVWRGQPAGAGARRSIGRRADSADDA